MMSKETVIVEDQLSARDLVLYVLRFLKFLGKNWRIILIASCLGSLMSVVFDYNNYKDPAYVAQIQFNLESGGAPAAGGMSAFASALGIPAGGGSAGGDLFSSTNFFELVNSKTIVEKLLMEEVNYKGKPVLFANLFITKSGIIKDMWAGSLFEKPNLGFINYRFKKKDPKELTQTENEIIKDIHSWIVDHTEFSTVGKSTISIMGVTSNDEQLSKLWAEKSLATMYDYYKEFKTAKTSIMLASSQRRSDSLRAVLQGTEQSMAAYTNANLGIVAAEGQMMQNRMARNTSLLTNQYTAAAMQTDQLKSLLESETPLFTIIEPVRLPLTKTVSRLGQNLFLGGMTAAILALFALFIYQTIQPYIAEFSKV
jgi:hypothetical protein